MSSDENKYDKDHKVDALMELRELNRDFPKRVKSINKFIKDRLTAIKRDFVDIKTDDTRFNED